MKTSLFLLLWLTVFPVFGDAIDVSLQQADDVRSKDFALFSQKLDALSQRQSAFTPQQQQYFNYLSAYRMSFTGKLEEAIPFYRAVYEGTDDTRLRLRAKTSLLNNYALMRDFLNALYQIPDMMPLLSQVDTEQRHLSLLAIALFYNQAEDYNQALQYSEQVLSEQHSERNRCLALNLKGESLHRNGQLTYSVLAKLLAACEASKEPIAYYLARLWEAQLFLEETGKEQSALQSLKDIQSDVESISYPRLTSEYYATLAQAYLANQQLYNASENARKGLELAHGMGFSRPIVIANRVLYEAANLLGNAEQALTYYIAYATADKAYLDELNVKQLALQQARFNVAEKAIEIKLLDKENHLLRTEAALAKKESQNHRLIIALLIALASLILVWAMITRRLHKALRSKAQTDELTKTTNRRHFTELANALLAYHKQNGSPVSFVIFDLDFFKTVNDRFGHPVGDWALKAVADTVKGTCRKEDILGRLGGEEFGLMLPGCDAEKAQEIAESLRIAVSQIDTSPSKHVFDITASFGITDTDQCGYDFQSLYGCADEALYNSKDSGRNQVFLYQSTGAAETWSTA